MKRISMKWSGLWKDAGGAAAIEYALIASIVSIAAVAMMIEVGNRSNDNYEVVVESLEQ